MIRQTVSVTAPQAKYLVAASSQLGITVSELVRRIIDSYRETEVERRRALRANGHPGVNEKQ